MIENISYTEDEIALAFAERYAGELAYASDSTARADLRWYERTPDGWAHEKTLRVQLLIRQLCAEIRECCDDPEIVARLSSRQMFGDIELLARCDPRLAKTREELGFPVKAKEKAKAKAKGISVE